MLTRFTRPPVLLSALVLVAALACPAQTPLPAQTDFRVGLKTITIPPPPSTNLVETGPDYRVRIEYFANPNSRIVAGFLLPDEFATLQTALRVPLTRYCLVEVVRSLEFTDSSAEIFQQIADALGREYRAPASNVLKRDQEGIEERLKIQGSSSTVTVDKTEFLGSLYAKQDAAAFGNIRQITVNGTVKKTVTVTAVVRVRERVLILRTHTPYIDQTSVKWAAGTSEKWADAVLAANTH